MPRPLLLLLLRLQLRLHRRHHQSPNVCPWQWPCRVRTTPRALWTNGGSFVASGSSTPLVAKTAKCATTPASYRGYETCDAQNDTPSGWSCCYRNNRGERGCKPGPHPFPIQDPQPGWSTNEDGCNIFTYDTGSTYEGEWLEGEEERADAEDAATEGAANKQRHRTGNFIERHPKALQEPVSEYKGQWQHDQQHGTGELLWHLHYEAQYGGQRFLQYYKDSKISETVYKYKGDFCEGKFHGKGVLTQFLRGFVYEGEFEQGLLHHRSAEQPCRGSYFWGCCCCCCC
jgi:hypothetical protein